MESGGWTAELPLLVVTSGGQTAIGANYQNAQSTLKKRYEEDMSVDEAMALAIRVLSKAMDSTSLDAEKGTFTMLERIDGVHAIRCS